MVRPEVPCDPLLRQRARPVQPLRVPSVGRHGPPPHQPSIRSSQLYPLNTPENPTGPQTESPRGSREPTSAIRGPRPEGARRPKRPKTNSDPPTPNQTAAVPDHRRPLTAARAGAEGATQDASLPATSASTGTPPVESRAAALQAGARPPSVPRWPSPRPHRHPVPPRQHRNLMRRAAGRGRSEPAVELRADSRDSFP